MKFSNKCNDYFIIRLRVYADKCILDKWHNTPGSPTPKQHMKRAEEYNKFFNNFFEFVTKIKYTDYMYTYSISNRECMIEELATEYDIVISDGEGWRTWFIPKDQTDNIKWLLDNVKLPHTTPSKTGIYMLQHRKKGTYWRDDSRKRTIKFNVKHNITTNIYDN